MNISHMPAWQRDRFLHMADSLVDDAPDYVNSDGLDDRQVSLRAMLLANVAQFDKFDEGTSSDGADYEEPDENDDAPIGLRCGNCVFFQRQGACDIVDGVIEANGICRFWIIPNALVLDEELLENDD